MTAARQKTGLTLIEILLAIAILALLVTITAVSTATLRKQAQVRLTESTLAVISSALQQYNEFWGTFPPEYNSSPAGLTDATAILRWNMATAAGCPLPSPLTAANLNDTTKLPLDVRPLTTPAYPTANTKYDVLYIRLARTPVCKRMIEGISSVSDQDKNRRKASLSGLTFTPDTTGLPYALNWGSLITGTGAPVPPVRQNTLPLYRFIDSWRNELRYEYSSSSPYPVLTSAGPDGNFGTSDDIKSSGK
jgi:prepilin-type N-terminal cleavage/methylation domain-containing protein